MVHITNVASQPVSCWEAIKHNTNVKV